MYDRVLKGKGISLDEHDSMKCATAVLASTGEPTMQGQCVHVTKNAKKKKKQEAADQQQGYLLHPA